MSRYKLGLYQENGMTSHSDTRRRFQQQTKLTWTKGNQINWIQLLLKWALLRSASSLASCICMTKATCQVRWLQEKSVPRGSQGAQTILGADSISSPHACPHNHRKTHTPKCYYLSYSKPPSLRLRFPTWNCISEEIHNTASTALNQSWITECSG